MVNKEVLKLLTPRKMQFEPIEEDNDELSEIIKNDPLTHDNQWDLHENLDGDKLQAFWTDAVNELGPLEAESEDDQ